MDSQRRLKNATTQVVRSGNSILQCMFGGFVFQFELNLCYDKFDDKTGSAVHVFVAAFKVTFSWLKIVAVPCAALCGLTFIFPHKFVSLS